MNIVCFVIYLFYPFSGVITPSYPTDDYLTMNTWGIQIT